VSTQSIKFHRGFYDLMWKFSENINPATFTNDNNSVSIYTLVAVFHLTCVNLLLESLTSIIINYYYIPGRVCSNNGLLCSQIVEIFGQRSSFSYMESIRCVKKK
jgi:hypothetical protein